MTFVMSLWKVEGMMGDDDSHHRRFKLGKSLTHPGDLSLVNAPTLDSERPRSVDPSKMYVREMDYRSHGSNFRRVPYQNRWTNHSLGDAGSCAGVSTRSALGCAR